MLDEPLSTAALNELVRAAKAAVPLGSTWRHYKGGVYAVLSVAIDEATMAPVVVYAAVDDASPPWVRKADVFLDGRFERLT